MGRTIPLLPPPAPSFPKRKTNPHRPRHGRATRPAVEATPEASTTLTTGHRPSPPVTALAAVVSCVSRRLSLMQRCALPWLQLLMATVAAPGAAGAASGGDGRRSEHLRRRPRKKNVLSLGMPTVAKKSAGCSKKVYRFQHKKLTAAAHRRHCSKNAGCSFRGFRLQQKNYVVVAKNTSSSSSGPHHHRVVAARGPAVVASSSPAVVWLQLLSK